MSKIVVGFDLSPSSQQALAWAAEYARLTGLPLQAVHAVPVPASVASIAVLGMPTPEPDGDIDEGYRREIVEAFEAVGTQPDWRLDFFVDDPGPAVMGASEDAAIVVMGTREHRGIGRLVYGSVSRYCLSHSKVPVVAVPYVPADAEKVADAGQAAAAGQGDDAGKGEG